jgi:hypothetical protein
MSPRLACHEHIYKALRAEMDHRAQHEDWVERERAAVATAAREWAAHAGYDRSVTVEDVERIETSAVGHCDYASKLALYVAELVTLQCVCGHHRDTHQLYGPRDVCRSCDCPRFVRKEP